MSESSELSGENLKISERSPPLVKEGNKKVMKVTSLAPAAPSIASVAPSRAPVAPTAMIVRLFLLLPTTP